MARKNKNKKPTANKKPSGVTIIKNVPVDDNGVPVQIKTHKDSKGGHPHVIVDNVDNKHVSVGLSTHAKKGRGKKSGTNYKLTKNPLGGDEQSYMRRQGTVAPIGEYEKPRKGRMTASDYKKAKEYGDKAKRKYLDKKNKKK